MERTRSRASRRPLLRWSLRHGRRQLTCQVERAGGRYRVSVRTHEGREQLFENRFDRSLQAFQRHAALVGDLRAMGWTIVTYR